MQRNAQSNRHRHNKPTPNLRRSLRSHSPSDRPGISRMDVIVIVVVVGVFIALIFPAVNSPRDASRRMQCMNNLHQLGLAATNYAALANGELPLLEDGTYGWPVALLPYLDANAIYREYTSNLGSTQKQYRLKFFTCPNDSNNFGKQMGLSYVANAGYGNFRVDSATGAVSEVGLHTADIDWDGNGTVDIEDRAVSRATGVFWRSHQDGFLMTLDYISEADGLTQTILFAENINARNWASRNTMDIAFVAGRETLGIEGKPIDGGPLRIQTETLGVFGINAVKGTFPGRLPAPSSNHPGSINVAFCDGHVINISKSIDPRVFARLMTLDGLRFGQSIVANDEFE